MPLRLIVTRDIPDTTQRELTEAWEEIGGLEPGEVITLLSADPPSFVQIMGDALQWIKTPLNAAAVVFWAQLAKESATDLYKHKEQLARAVWAVGAVPLRRAAESLRRVRDGSGGRTAIVLGLSTPDDHFGTALHITDQSEQEIAYLIAAFVIRAEAIESAVRSEVEAGRAPVGRIHVALSGGGGLTLEWVDRQFVEHRREIA